MALTPVDIHNKRFNRKLRGYNEDEVDTFLDQMMKDLEIIIREKVDLGREVNELKTKLQYFTNMESTLNQSILIAQETAEQVKENAKKGAELIIKEAEKNADRIINDSLNESRKAAMEMESLKRQSNIFKARLSMLVKAQLDMINTEDWDNLEDLSMLDRQPVRITEQNKTVQPDQEYAYEDTPVQNQEQYFDSEPETQADSFETEKRYRDNPEAIEQVQTPLVEEEYVYEEESQGYETSFEEPSAEQDVPEQEEVTPAHIDNYNPYQDTYAEEQVIPEIAVQEKTMYASQDNYEPYRDSYSEEQKTVHSIDDTYEAFREPFTAEQQETFEGQQEAPHTYGDSYEQYRESYQVEQQAGQNESTTIKNPDDYSQAKQLTEAALARASATEEPFTDDYSMDYSERSFYKFEKE